VELSGKLLALKENADLGGTLKLEHVQLTHAILEALPDKLGYFKDNFDVVGPTSCSIEVHRQAGKWRERCLVSPEKLAGTFRKFPYRLERVAGTIEHEHDEARNLDAIRIDVVGYADSQPVYIRGKADGRKPAGIDLKIWGNNIPVDDRLSAALQPRFEKIARSFKPSGLVDIEAHIQRDAGTVHFANRYLAHFHDAAIRYEVFPYPIDEVSGTLEILSDRWEFRDFQGSHKGGSFQSHGGSMPTARGAEIKIEITGTNIALDSEMEKSLTRPGMKDAWKKLEPGGRMNFAARVDMAPGRNDPEISLTLIPRNATLRPAFFPCPLTGLQGVVHFHDREIELDKLSARHEYTQLSLERGKVYLKPEGGVSIDLRNFVGNPIVPDSELVQALPGPLSKTCASLELREPLSMRIKQFTIDMPAEAGQPPQVYWDGGIRFKNAHLRPGITLDHVSGILYCRGEYKGKLGNVVGDLLLDEAVAFRQPLRQVQGQAIIRAAEPNIIALPNLKAQLFGGDLHAKIRADFGSPLRYEVDLTASQIKLEELGKENRLGPSAKLSGMAEGRLYLQGTGTDLHGLEGAGTIDVPNGKMYNLPLILDLLKFLNLRLPDRTAFEEAHARFAIHGGRADISRIDLLGNAVSFGGHGAVNLDGSNIDMELYAVWARIGQLSPPIIKEIWPAMSKMLLKIRMKGKVGETPHFEKEPVPVLVDPLKELLQQMQGRQR
jgi:hypothetical protein